MNKGKSRRNFSSNNSTKSFKNKKSTPKIRLNKFIANSGLCSRREADKFIEAGVVTVNGKGITELGHKVNPTDIIKFNNQKINAEQFRYLVLNKPKNYTTKIQNNKNILSVMNLISSSCKETIYPMDKLNKSETGLLIFSNDVDLLKKIGSKTKKIKSIYHIKLDKNLKQKDLEYIKNADKKKIDMISYIKNSKKNEVGVEHSFGGIKYIKEIFLNLNYKILQMDRVFLAGLTKKNLPRQHYRHLTKTEINILKRL